VGWARSQVAVIDDDLGVSAATPDSRKGFARLVTEVTMGRAGIVLGIEMSRLARTGRDWHQTSSAVTQAAGAPASSARLIMAWASAGFLAVTLAQRQGRSKGHAPLSRLTHCKTTYDTRH
jgi:hypothetical protein